MRYIKKVIVIILAIILCSNVYSETTTNKLGLEEYVSTIDEHIKDSQLGDVFNVKDMTQDLISGNGIEYNTMIGKLLNIFLKEVLVALKGAVSIIIILVLITLLKNLEIEER